MFGVALRLLPLGASEATSRSAAPERFVPPQAAPTVEPVAAQESIEIALDAAVVRFGRKPPLAGPELARFQAQFGQIMTLAIEPPHRG